MTPTEEKELLLRVVTQLAGLHLEHGGGFIPFGAALDSKREVQVLTPEHMKPNVTQEELEAYWSRELREVVAKGECNIVSYCVAVLVYGEDGAQHPAIHVHIEQSEADPEDLFYPYRKDERSKIVFGEPTRSPAVPLVFR